VHARRKVLNTLRLLIDCDPGIDDALALYAALGSRGVRVRGVTTVFGNVSVRQATRNVVRALQFVPHIPAVPMAQGAAAPWSGRRRARRQSGHGRDGLGDLGIPSAVLTRAVGDGTRLIVEQITRGSIDELIALGPLTNVAQALRQATPRVRRASTVVVSAGGEFNLASDPAAARWLLRSGARVRWIPVQMTASVVMPKREVRAFRRTYRSSRLGRVMARWLAYRATIPDAIAMALSIAPSMGRWRARRLVVASDRRGQRGRLRREPGASNALVCEHVDAARVRAWLWRAWARTIETSETSRCL